MKLDWKKTFLIGLGFFGISVIWQLYNSFVPLFLQLGNPAFESTREAYGFGLNASTTGFVMGIDNIAAIFILPLIGAWSDRVRTPIGRRYPFILTMAPVAAISFLLMPIAAGMITPETNGSIGANQGAFILFMIGAILMLLAMAVLRTPVISLMPDLTPSPLRSKANGVINLMGGIAVILSSFVIARLFDIRQIIPFIVGSVIMIGAVILLFVTTKEPPVDEMPHPEAHEDSDEEQALKGLKSISIVPKEYRKSLLFLMASIFFWFLAYDGINTFFTSYAVAELGVTEGFAPTLFGIAGLTFIIFAIPAGFIGESLGRRRTIQIGLGVFAALLVVGYIVNNTVGVGIVLGVGGMGWALVNINSLPMIVDTADDERLLGTYTGLYYLASQTGSALAPLVSGAAVDLTGGNYRTLFLIGPAFFVLAIITMSFVTRGEPKDVKEIEITSAA